MIKVQNGRVEISGTGLEITSDLTYAVRGVKNALKSTGFPPEVIEALVADAIRHADMTNEEVVNEALDSLKSLFEKIFKTPKTETENGGNIDDKKPE